MAPWSWMLHLIGAYYQLIKKKFSTMIIPHEYSKKTHKLFMCKCVFNQNYRPPIFRGHWLHMHISFWSHWQARSQLSCIYNSNTSILLKLVRCCGLKLHARNTHFQLPSLTPKIMTTVSLVAIWKHKWNLQSLFQEGPGLIPGAGRINSTFHLYTEWWAADTWWVATF